MAGINYPKLLKHTQALRNGQYKTDTNSAIQCIQKLIIDTIYFFKNVVNTKAGVGK